MILCFDDFEFDLQRLELRRSGAPVRADPTVLRVLHALLQSPGQVVTKAELLARVWDRRAMSASILSVSITRLRKTLGHTPGTREFVLNVPGRGYRFVRSVTKREATTDTSSGGESIPPPAGPLIVGREAVTTRMQRLLASAGAGRGGVCMLTGEAGIGKTASAAQLAATAVASGIRVAWAYCQEIGETPPLWPFAQLVRALLRDASARDIAALAPELSALVPELATRSSRPPLRATSKHRMFEAVLDVLERRDTVLIIDDLHRADAASCELLRYWMDRLGQQRVLVVATLRSLRSRGARIVPDLSFVAGHVNCTCIALERLTPESVEAYVRRILPASDATLTHAIWAKSEGNPFFMLELVRQLADVARPAVELLRISDEALLLLAPRIAELEVAARGLLSVAAVIGRRFELRLLQSLSGQDLETLTEDRKSVV